MGKIVSNKVTKDPMPRDLGFYVLIGSQSVEVRDDALVGRCSREPEEFYGPLAAQLANCPPEPESITAFTQKYGPLGIPQKNGTGITFFLPVGAGAPFLLPLELWKYLQTTIRASWEMYAPQELRAIPSAGGLLPTSQFLPIPGIGQTKVEPGTMDTEANERFYKTSSGLVYKVANPYRYALFELAMTPPERLRKCPRPGCTTPYFIAKDFRQVYCTNTECSQWGKARAQQDWKQSHRHAPRPKRAKVKA